MKFKILNVKLSPVQLTKVYEGKKLEGNLIESSAVKKKSNFDKAQVNKIILFLNSVTSYSAEAQLEFFRLWTFGEVAPLVIRILHSIT